MAGTGYLCLLATTLCCDIDNLGKKKKYFGIFYLPVNCRG